MADKKATREAYEKVEAEITKITKSKFKVNLDLYYYTEEQYYGVQEFDRKEYEKLKLGLWKKFEHNRDGYTEAKSEFVKKITSTAKYK